MCKLFVPTNLLTASAKPSNTCNHSSMAADMGGGGGPHSEPPAWETEDRAETRGICQLRYRYTPVNKMQVKCPGGAQSGKLQCPCCTQPSLPLSPSKKIILTTSTRLRSDGQIQSIPQNLDSLVRAFATGIIRDLQATSPWFHLTDSLPAVTTNPTVPSSSWSATRRTPEVKRPSAFIPKTQNATGLPEIMMPTTKTLPIPRPRPTPRLVAPNLLSKPPAGTWATATRNAARVKSSCALASCVTCT